MIERVHSLIATLRSRSAHRGRMEISCDETGFELRPFGRTDQTTKLNWQQITEIIAYKRDCFTVDLICLAIADPATVVEINEEDAGWDPFIQAVATNLPGSVARDTWWTAVAQTPFATNQTIVYRKSRQPEARVGEFPVIN